MRETKHEITVEAEIVIANCLKNNPPMPEIKAAGTTVVKSARFAHQIFHQAVDARSHNVFTEIVPHVAARIADAVGILAGF